MTTTLTDGRTQTAEPLPGPAHGPGPCRTLGPGPWLRPTSSSKALGGHTGGEPPGLGLAGGAVAAAGPDGGWVGRVRAGGGEQGPMLVTERALDRRAGGRGRGPMVLSVLCPACSFPDPA